MRSGTDPSPSSRAGSTLEGVLDGGDEAPDW